MWQCFLKLFKVLVTHVVEVNNEILIEYASFAAERVSNNTNVYEWWEDKRLVYPKLYVVAYVMMLVKPSSVACESVFSRCSRLMTKYRSAMEPSTMDCCKFLNGNPYLFEKALEKVSKKWRPQSSNIRKNIENLAPTNSLKAFEIDWNRAFNEVGEIIVEDSTTE